MKISLKSFLLCTTLLTPITPCVAMEASDMAAAEQEVRESVIAFNRAYEENDLEGYFSFYQADATMWFNADFVAIADYEKDWNELIGNGGRVELNTLTNLRVKLAPGGDAAVAAYQLEVQTRMPDGSIAHDLSQESDTWFKTDGQWKVVHLHYVSNPKP